jgi:hypothetical protein
MKQMSEFLRKLEGFADLEVSIIRATKINKVLKAILKLPEIPRDSEFQIRNRSKALLEIWGKLLGSAERPAAPGCTPGDSDMPAISISAQPNPEKTLLPPAEIQVGVIDDWVLVIHAEEGNVILEEGTLKVE